MTNTIGFTSTIPVDIIYATGQTPVDINNIFVTNENSIDLIEYAKKAGFPETTCSWICGLYGAILKNNIKKVIGVTGGDCSETIALMEVLSLNGVEVIHFDYPSTPDKNALKISLNKLADKLGTTLEKGEQIKTRLNVIRKKVDHLDSLLWKHDLGTGKEVQFFQLDCSDFQGNPDNFETKVDDIITDFESRKKNLDGLRLGYLGVPPIIENLYDKLEEDGSRVVFSEVQRQFSLPFDGSLDEIYTQYTYPYGIFERLKDIKHAIKERKIDGLIHYVQSFCFRSIEDIVLRKELDIPILTLQGDLPSKVTATIEIRIEAFLDMLHRKKRK